MFRNQQVRRTQNRENRKPPGNTFLREGILGPIRWVDQNLLVFGSDANKDRFSRPVTVVKKNDIRIYVLPMTTTRSNGKFCIEKDNKHINYIKQKCNKNSYIHHSIEVLTHEGPGSIGDMCAIFISGEGDLRPQIAKWYGQERHVMKVKS